MRRERVCLGKCGCLISTKNRAKKMAGVGKIIETPSFSSPKLVSTPHKEEECKQLVRSPLQSIQVD